ncbi:MAG TPA: hypothetical protein VEW93_11445 [Acidimicrobiales bacterium]|nr:hypothetical protein [Acidimicrobiales bacterium]
MGPARRTQDGPWHGIEVDVDGRAVTFELLDHRPSDRVEAVLTAYVPSALAAGATLVPHRAVDPGWAAGVDRAAALMATWWDHAPASPVRPPEPAAGEPPPAPPPGRGTALCFTGGVDSFWALLHGGHDPTHLLYVVGYDIDRDDTDRVESQMGAVRAVATALGLAPLFVRTDLRAQPAITAANWGRDHGAAIAAAGLVASDVVERLVVPPSYANGRLIPWGSRPDLDHLWSAPGTLAVEHSPTDLPRFDRVRAIAAEPLPQQHLRVCWEHRTADANCGQCEKCVRTMAMLATTPHLAAFATMPGRQDLADRIRDLHPLPEHHVRMWRDLRGTGLPADVAAAVDHVTAEPPPP